jgi:hypothetical protein
MERVADTDLRDQAPRRVTRTSSNGDGLEVDAEAGGSG